MSGLFVTGTDTGVGKTLVSAGLVRWARARGLRVGAMKPAESGCARRGDELVPADAELLRWAAGGTDSLDLVCPHRLEAPLAPGIAATREGKTISLERVREALGALSRAHPDGVIVEGAGGLLVPMAPDFRTGADWAKALELPALVVARAGLGTINHTALTVEALRTRGIPCRGVILSAQRPEDEGAAPENAAAIERLTGAEVLATLPLLEGGDDRARAEEAARHFEVIFSGRKLDPSRLLA